MKYEDYEKLNKAEASKKHTKSTLNDLVNSPLHYNKTGVECINAIEAVTEDGFEYYLQ